MPEAGKTHSQSLVQEFKDTEHTYRAKLQILQGVIIAIVEKIEVSKNSEWYSFGQQLLKAQPFLEEMLKQSIDFSEFLSKDHSLQEISQKLVEIHTLPETIRIHTEYVKHYEHQLMPAFLALSNSNLSQSKKDLFKPLAMYETANPEREINNFLILPIQRIPRYELLLRDGIAKMYDPKVLSDGATFTENQDRFCLKKSEDSVQYWFLDRDGNVQTGNIEISSFPDMIKNKIEKEGITSDNVASFLPYIPVALQDANRGEFRM